MKDYIQNLIKELVEFLLTTNESHLNLSSQFGIDYPGIPNKEITNKLTRIADLLSHPTIANDSIIVGNLEARIASYYTYIKTFWSQTDKITPTYILSLIATLDWYELELTKIIEPHSSETVAKNEIVLNQKLSQLIQFIEDLEYRKMKVLGDISIIEEGIMKADSLVARNSQFESFDENLEEIEQLVAEYTSNNAKLNGEIQTKNGELSLLKEQADSIITRCEAAYSAATTVGLAKSFVEKADVLGKTVIFWGFILVGTLLVGGYLANQRLEQLLEVINTTLIKQRTTHIEGFFVGIELLLLSFTFGGTIWIAWLATKQISVNFKLKEDYDFKATFAMAYEGYRKEAVRIDPDLEKRLFTCAIERLEESPIRLINNEKENHTPIQEVLNTKFSEKSIDFLTSLKTDIVDVVKSSVSKKD